MKQHSSIILQISASEAAAIGGGQYAERKKTYVSVVSVEDVERRVVVMDVSEVVGQVLHLQLHAAAVVVLATFELLVSVLLRQTLKREE